MATERQLVDTNLLVRFFTGDPPDMASKARRQVERADEGELLMVILPVILAETFFTLESYYQMERKQVAGILLSFLECQGIEAIESERLKHALVMSRDQNAHFADAYLAASALELGNSVSSFDRDFDKIKGVRRIEPKL